jgi:hypothetical protein
MLSYHPTSIRRRRSSPIGFASNRWARSTTRRITLPGCRASSIEHIRATPGYPDGDWPPASGTSLEENLSDLSRHADDFKKGTGFTFTVLDTVDDDVIGCVYLYPPTSEEYDVTVQSWVRADRAGLDAPLAAAVANWVATDWPWERLDRCGR